MYARREINSLLQPFSPAPSLGVEGQALVGNGMAPQASCAPSSPTPFLWGRPTMLSSGISLWESDSKMNALLFTSQLVI